MKKALIYLLFFLIAFKIKAQDPSLTGIVSNEKGEPVRGATVFIANSKKITTTNDNGKFTFGQLQAGAYEIVVSMLGFVTYNKSITIQGKSVDLSIRLKESNTSLEAIVIKHRGVSDRDRARYLQIFIRNFIGESLNADREILNPEVLSFYYDKENNVLEASSNGFLIIENHNLGYKINYLVDLFKLDMKSTVLFYQGTAYFEESEGPASVQKQWDENREIAYNGSIRHFFKAGFNHTTEAEGFLVYDNFPGKEVLDKLSSNELLKFTPISTDSLFTTFNEDFKLLNLKGPDQLYVIYTREKESPDFIRSGRSIELPTNFPSRIRQISTIRRIADDSLIVDRNGNFSFKSLLAYGYWSWEATAEMVPLDYVSHSAGRPVDSSWLERKKSGISSK